MVDTQGFTNRCNTKVRLISSDDITNWNARSSICKPSIWVINTANVIVYMHGRHSRSKTIWQYRCRRKLFLLLLTPIIVALRDHGLRVLRDSSPSTSTLFRHLVLISGLIYRGLYSKSIIWRALTNIWNPNFLCLVLQFGGTIKCQLRRILLAASKRSLEQFWLRVQFHSAEVHLSPPFLSIFKILILGMQIDIHPHIMFGWAIAFRIL